MTDPKYNLQEMIYDILNETSSREGMLRQLPHNPVNLKKIIDRAKSEKIFKLKDKIPGKYCALETYMLGSKDYATIVYEEVAGKSCMGAVERRTVAFKHTTSMESAVQLHYDALGYLSNQPDL